MDCSEDDEGPQRILIAEELLSLPARKVLIYRKVRDPLSLQLNLLGALKNWKDVADLLDYTPEMILGHFAHSPRPGLLLLEDWVYEKNGVLRSLVDVFTELQLYACLEVIHECVQEYEEKLVKTNKPREDDDDIADVQGYQGRYEHDIDTEPSSMSSHMTESSTMVSSTDCRSTEQTSSMPSECSTTSSLLVPPSFPYSVTTHSKSFDNKIEDLGCDCKEFHGKCFSSDDVSNGGTERGATAAVSRPEFFRFKSWSGAEAHDKRQESLLPRMNRSHSHEPSEKKSKDRKKSLSKRFVNLLSRSKRHKKSTGQSSSEGNTAIFVSNGEPSLVTSCTAMDSYSEPAQKPHENLSPLKVTEARRLSLTDSLSSGENVASPVSPGYESGYMSSEGPSGNSGKTISIIHCSDLEGKAFQEKVFDLYNQFSRTLGYKCHLDKLEIVKVAENKFRYAVKSVQQSDFVFICISPELKRIFDSSLEEISDSLEGDEECMLRLESDLILADLASNASNRKGKFMTILLKGSSKSDVPYFLNLYMKYHWPKDEQKIVRMIKGLPEIVPVPVGNVKTDPPSLVVKPAKLN